MVVDSYFEALALRRSGIKISLLIIGYTPAATILSSKLKNIAFTITSLETLREISEIKRKITIHLKIDTGMHRQGIYATQIPAAIHIIKNNTHIHLEGTATHLSDSDNHDSSFTLKQIHIWNSVVQKFKQQLPTIKWFHASATYGHNYSKKIQANISRLGIGLYGLAENFHNVPHLKLKPVLEMKTIISDIKEIHKGESVGYNNTFTTRENMTIATIPAGYFEGIDRHLSNIGQVLVGKNRIACNIIGRVSMNITCIDISKLPQVHINDEVIVISANSYDPNSISSITKKIPHIPYELVVKIPAHLKRVVV